ncbi:EamA-like transporter family protein [Pirellula sp. SH-Sr6A]|uniref:DMT family transporter n=1 Tax=Pirellula sp. SH-Sr6A TaxID=1632865 RepID=UPI00078E225B|nr:DMT family transporter [Pirellula sp. SH-Sr6A]AMV33889.1 EamA-like transporter family protein [Pirellula sp. SH-Sr6A]
MPIPRPVLVAIIALIGVNALWGMSFPVMKSLNEVMEDHFGVANPQMPTSMQVACSAGLIGMRFTIASFLLSVVLPKLFFRTSKAEWIAGFWIGMLFCLGLILQVVGLATIPASRSGFLTSLTAVYTPLMASFLLKQRPSVFVCIGSLLALTGVAILSDAHRYVLAFANVRWADDSSTVPLNWGDLWTTLGALFFSGQVLLVDTFGKRYRSAHLTPGMFVTAALTAWVFFVVSRQWLDGSEFSQSIDVSWSTWLAIGSQPAVVGLLLFLAIFCSILSFLGMNTFQPAISASQASVIYSTEPVFASSWAMLLPGIIGWFIAIDYQNESFTWQLGAGGILILFANIIALWPTQKREIIDE